MKRGILIIALLLVSLTLINGINGCSQTKALSECNVDNDCIKVSTTCCSCEMGGDEKCVLKGTGPEFLPKDCPENLACIALYNCKIKECLCEEGKCKEKLMEE